MIARAPEQQVSFFWTIIFLVAGLAPLLMLVRFWMASGTGLHPFLVGYTLAHGISLLVSLNYFMYYRRYKPRSIVKVPAITTPDGLVRAVLLTVTMLMLLGVGSYNMLAQAHGLGLTLSPGPVIARDRVLSTMAKVVGTALSPGLLTPVHVPLRKPLDIKRQRWLVKPPFVYGALWGALGYAIPFGFLGMVLGFLRQELPDPRDEHVGMGFSARLVRGAVAFYYGGAIGFLLGAALIVVMRTLFPSVSVATPAVILHWIYSFGAASHPNVAFSYAFSSGCLLAGAFGLILGRVDFTARVSDPKAAEFTRPIEVQIPPIEPPPLEAFDPVRVEAESQRVLKQFELECASLLRLPDWTVERYEMPMVTRAGAGVEPETTNVISARDGLPPDDDGTSAMGSLSNVYVQIVADLGRLEISAADWLAMAEGVILELPKAPDGTIGVSINGRLAGRGRPLTINGNKAVKMISLKSGVEKLLKVNPG